MVFVSHDSPGPGIIVAALIYAMWVWFTCVAMVALWSYVAGAYYAIYVDFRAWASVRSYESIARRRPRGGQV